MIFWLLLATLGGFFVARATLDAHRVRPGWKVGEFFGTLGVGVLITGVSVILYFVGLGIYTSSAGTVYTGKYDLAALGNGSSTTGKFFLGSGYVKDRQVFNYLMKESDGGVTLMSVDARYSTVYEDATDGAQLHVHQRILDDGLWAPFDIPEFGHQTYDFHVPAGTVNNEYVVSVTG